MKRRKYILRENSLSSQLCKLSRALYFDKYKIEKFIIKPRDLRLNFFKSDFKQTINMCLSLYHANSGVPQASPENKRGDFF